VAIHCALIYGDKSSTLFVGALADTSIWVDTEIHIKQPFIL
jgi:hypothetical protein